MIRTIAHVDMDAFYASVEQRRRPELRGRPVIVGGEGARGVVAAASYEARRYGIRSAMPSVQAQRLCPHAVFVPGDHAHYAAVSTQVMEILGRFTPLVEPLSLDEAFLDLTGARRLHGDGEAVAHRVRALVRHELHLTCTVGVAPSKFLAKLASQAAKPTAGPRGPVPGAGVVVVPPGEELAFLHPLPVQALWGVGPRTLERLGRRGITTVGDLALVDERSLATVVGRAAARHLLELAHAHDPRPVVPDQRPKSVGHEETYRHDHHDAASLHVELVRLTDAVARRLRGAGVTGRTVSLKVRFADFRTITRSATLPVAVDTAAELRRAASALLDRVDPSPGVRLLGVHVSNLDPGGARQLTFDDQGSIHDDLAGAIDAIRDRFGADAVVPGTLAGPGGIRIRRSGDQQWGPGAPRSDPGTAS